MKELRTQYDEYEGIEEDNEIKDYFGFKKLITPMLIKVIYVLGIFAIIWAGWKFMTLSEQAINRQLSDYLARVGIGIWLIGNLLWRVVCEMMISIFKVCESLNQILNEIRNS